MSQETLIFQDGKISVSKTLVRVGSRSYPINGIGSVDVENPKRGKTFMVALIAGIAAWISISEGNELNGFGVCAAIICALAIITLFLLPYVLVLRTASGDQQALTQRNKDYLLRVKAAIEQAVVTRG